MATHGCPAVRTVLVANKCDLQRHVSTEEARAFALKHNMLYVETSAKTGLNVDEPFLSLANDVFVALHLHKPVSELSGAAV